MGTAKINDWSGGITDHYLNGPLNRSQRLNNLLITRNRKPVTRNGSLIYNSTYDQIPAGSSRISKIVYFDSVLFQQSAREVYYVGGSGWVTMDGPVANNPVFGAGTVTSHISHAEWNNELLLTTDTYSTPRKIYKDSGGTWRVNNLGLPSLASSPTATLDSTGAVNISIIYGFCYKHTYTVGTVTHVVRGPVTTITAIDAAGSLPAPGTPCAITGIPVIANGTTECYATGDIQVEIYRTINGLVDLKYVGAVTNGTTTYSDTVVEASLGIDIYTAGDVVDNDEAPKAKYVIVADGVTWYLNVKEGSEERTNRARQALKDQPDAAPASFLMDVEGAISGGGVIDVYPIVFTKTSCYRFEGYVDNQGRGFTRKRVISRTVGCISHNSIVAVLGGLYFAAADGFYFTDGYRVQKVSGHLNVSYKSATATETMQKRIYGALDPQEGRIYWTMTTDSTETDCDQLWVLDPYWGISGEMCFTTWSSEADMSPTALTFVGNDLVRADRRGYVLRHDVDTYTDPEIDTGVAAASWTTKAVEYDYISVAMSMDTEIQKKYSTKITVVAKNETNLSLLVQSINDDSGYTKDLKEIRFRSNIVWGDIDTVWGDPSIIWNYAGTILAERMFPKGSLHFIYKQIRMTNAMTALLGSDDYGNVTSASAGPTVIFDDLAQTWPTGIENYSIFFAGDGYEQGFVINTISGDTLNLLDPNGLMPADGSHEWVIRGHRKGERFSLESYAVEFMMFGEFTPGYSAEGSGENA